MSKVLIGWEMGGGLGHLYPLVEIAKELKRQGHEVLVVCRDTGALPELLKGTGIGWGYAPYMQIKTKDTLGCHAQILENHGFRNPSELSSLITGWIEFIERFQPDRIIADSCPILTLAAKIKNIPCLRVSTGYFDPDPSEALPLISPTYGGLAKAFKESAVLTVINTALSGFGQIGFNSLKGLYNGPIAYLTWAVTNPFSRTNQSDHIGAIPTATKSPDPKWRSMFGPRAFCYLDAQVFDAISDKLLGAGLVLSVLLKGTPTAKTLELAKNHQIYLNNGEVNFNNLHEKTSLMICHGGVTMNTAIAQGMRVLAFPIHREHQLNAEANEARGLPVKSYVAGQDNLGSLLDDLRRKPIVKLPQTKDVIGHFLEILFSI